MNLFILVAPYQILSALEAIHYFNLSDNHLWVIDNGLFSRQQFNSVINDDQWQSVTHHSFRYKLTHLDFGKNPPASFKELLQEKYLVLTQIIQKNRANRITEKVGPINYLFMGNYRLKNNGGFMRHLANRIHHRKLVILDPGTDIFRINQDREIDQYREENKSRHNSTSNLYRRVKAQLKEKLMGWDVSGAPQLTFFTAYDLQPHGRDRVVRHKFDFAKSLIARSQPSNEVFFVSQPLVTQGYVDTQTFRKALAHIKDFFTGYQIVYIQHPRETTEELDIVRDLAMESRRLDTPFEYAMAHSTYKPKSIASFFSSIIENSALLFDDDVTLHAFRLPDNYFKKDHAEISRLYDSFSKNKKIQIHAAGLDETPL